MRVIFSRKGFDGGAGGCPSPIIDDACISMPIPTSMPSTVTYADLRGLHGEIIEDLTHGCLNRHHLCHLDPDVNEALLDRHPGWRGALGQTGAAQGHLHRAGIDKGDLFLFWGVFRRARRNGCWKFEGRPEHRIFGWLQVGEIVALGADGSHVVDANPWLADHPHTRAGWSAKNTLYVASDELRLNDMAIGLPGWGTLDNGFLLTADSAGDKRLPSKWAAPTWLNPRHGGCGMTYHKAIDRWDEATVQTVGRGQEFVASPNDATAAADWIGRALGIGPAP